MFSLTHNIRRTTIYTGQDTQTYKLSYVCSRFACLWCLVPLATIFQLCRSILLMEETGVPVENPRPVASQ